MTILTGTQYTKQMARGLPLADSTSGSQNKFVIFKGTIPSNLTNWTEASNAADKLVEFNNFFFVQSGSRVLMSAAPNPSIKNATASGTASWYAWYPANNPTRYLFGDVSDVLGTGSLQLDSVTITSGNPVQFINWAIEYTTT